MTDHPILFQGDMVQAIMTCASCGTVTLEIECPKCGSKERRKTQTRRIIKPQPAPSPWSYQSCGVIDGEAVFRSTLGHANNPPVLHYKCPHGVPGDLLGVRESHWVSTCGQYIAMPGGSRNNYSIPPDNVCSTKSVSTDIRSSGRRFELQDGSVIHAGSPVGSKGEKDMLNCVVMIDGHRRDLLFRRRSPIFMPKRACRLWLKVKSVRAERVQEISDEDVVSEGIESLGWDFAESSDGTGAKFMYWDDPSMDMPKWCPDGTTSCECATDIFSYLWDSINAKPKPRYRTINGKKQITHYESYPWANIRQTRRYRDKPWHVYGNPHIFATEFERYDK